MTNHPRRQHDKDTPASKPDPAPPAPPAFTANGNSAVIGRAVAEALAEALPQMLFQAVGQALQQVPVTVKPLRCATCVLAQLKWGQDHAAEITRAEEAFRQAAAEMGQRAPEDQVPLNGMEFLPEQIRPGGEQGPPPVQDGAVMAGGTLYCAGHVPGAPSQPGKRTFLIAHQPLSSGLLADMMRGQAA